MRLVTGWKLLQQPGIEIDLGKGQCVAELGQFDRLPRSFIEPGDPDLPLLAELPDRDGRVESTSR